MTWKSEEDLSKKLRDGSNMIRRINKEIALVAKTGKYQISPLINQTICLSFHGPNSTLYDGGVFGIEVSFPENYPLNSPKVRMVTKVYHPNVGPSGEICIPCLSDWKVSFTLKTIIEEIEFMLRYPNVDNPLVPEIAKVFVTDIQLYERNVKSWVDKYAHL